MCIRDFLLGIKHGDGPQTPMHHWRLGGISWELLRSQPISDMRTTCTAVTHVGLDDGTDSGVQPPLRDPRECGDA